MICLLTAPGVMPSSAPAAGIPPARATHSNVAKADRGGNCRMTLSIKEMVSDVYSLFYIRRTQQAGAHQRLRTNTKAKGRRAGVTSHLLDDLADYAISNAP